MRKFFRSLQSRVQELLAKDGQPSEGSSSPAPVDAVVESGDHVCDWFDLDDPEFMQDPYAAYQKLCEKGSVLYLARSGVWLVLGYDEATEVLKDPELFSSQPAVGFDSVLLAAEPSEHRDARAKLAPSFSSYSVAGLKKLIEDNASRLLDQVGELQEFDLLEDYSVPLSERVIGSVLGIGDDALERLRCLPGKGRYHIDYLPALDEFFGGYLASGESKGKDLSPPMFRRFNADEKVGLMKTVWVAGTLTTGILICSAVNILFEKPDVMTELKGDPSLMSQFLEEVLRFEPPEKTVWRLTTRATELGGVKLPEGAALRICLSAANRDPSRYSNPDRFELRRDQAHQLAFGSGPHHCIGSHLSRLEAGIAISMLLDRFPDLAPVKPIEQRLYLHSDHLRALQELPVRVR